MAHKCQHALELLGGLAEHRFLGLTPRVSDSADLGWELRICISSKFSGDAVASGLGTTL